ncbi:MAG: FkbM family methyltransferase [Desulfobulbaceae bacterium]
MGFLRQCNRIISRFGLEVINKKDLDRLVYSSSVNRRIESSKAEDGLDPFADQHTLVNKQDPTIFDVGSYVGDIACKYVELFPRATVYAFEPTSASFHELEKKASQIKNIQAYNYALADSIKRETFYLNKFSPTNSLLKPSVNASNTWGENLLDTREEILVECTTIDSFCSERDITHIDILKLDVQGGELRVLDGARNMLGKGKIGLLYTEIIFADTYQNQVKLADLLQCMEKYQFAFFNFYNHKYLNHRLIQADLIFVHNSLV